MIYIYILYIIMMHLPVVKLNAPTKSWVSQPLAGSLPGDSDDDELAEHMAETLGEGVWDLAF